VYLSYTVNDATNITFDGSLTAKQGCNGTSIYLLANHNPPYTVYGADFWGTPGCGTVMSVDESGALQEVIQDFEYLDEKSSIHGLAMSPDSDILYSADTYGNNIWTHAVSKTTGLVGDVLDQTAGPSPGSNPRHVSLHPSGKALYAVTEGSNEVVWYKTDNGIPIQQEPIYPLLPANTNSSMYWGDAVIVTPSGRYLWATTRARDRDGQGYISAFSLADDGDVEKQLLLVPTTSSGGVANAVTPSDFDDRFVAITDNSEGFVEIWALENGEKKCPSARPVARIELADQGNERYKSGCCANVVWLS
jgi:carboxy-cis,cis-muconate cyclase